MLAVSIFDLRTIILLSVNLTFWREKICILSVNLMFQDKNKPKKMIYSCLLYLISIRIHIWIYSYSYSYSYHHLQPSLSLIYSNRYLRLYIVRSFQKNLEFVLCCGWDGVRKSLNKLQRWDSVPYITAITSTTFFSSFIYA